MYMANHILLTFLILHLAKWYNIQYSSTVVGKSAFDYSCRKFKTDICCNTDSQYMQHSTVHLSVFIKKRFLFHPSLCHSVLNCHTLYSFTVYKFIGLKLLNGI